VDFSKIMALNFATVTRATKCKNEGVLVTYIYLMNLNIGVEDSSYINFDIITRICT
jgi:hypothetical protein